MKSIGIGSQISVHRKQKKLTQEDLAYHLGVTKAAVSKWELGLSFPDISQLPKIAALFEVTIDDLLDYKPELSDEEITKISTRISRVMQDDSESALHECREYIKRYYSCPRLVLTLSHLMYSSAVRDNHETPNQEIMDEIIGYLSHVITCGEIESSRNAQFCRANLYLLQNKTNEAIEQFKVLMPQQTLEVEGSLAAAYERSEMYDKAIRVHQENLYWKASSALNSCLSLLLLSQFDLDELNSLSHMAQSIAEALSVNEQGSMQLLSFYFSTSCAYRKGGHKDRAYDYLTRFADLALNYRDFIIPNGADVPLYSHIQDIVNPDIDENSKEYFENTVVDIYALGIKQMISSSPEWADAAEEPQFIEIREKIEGI